MKLHKYTSNFLALLVIFTLTNCQDLSYDEATGNTNEEIFNDIGRSKQFISGIYAYLPTDYNSIDGAMRSAATDDAEHVNDLSNVQKFNDGSWSAVQQLDNVWNNMYNGIRAANVYLKEAEGKTFPDQQYVSTYANLIKQFNNYPFEVRFLRAYFYFELIKRYKSVPLITTVLTPEEAVNVEQASFEEIVDFIVNECDDITTDDPVNKIYKLPLDYTAFAGVNETGRATKGAALALKARVLLYAASPLHNTSNDLVLWQKAAKAAKQVLDLGIYTLPSSYSSNFTMLVALPSSELIMERRVAASNDFEKRNFPIGYEGGGNSFLPGTCPTQNLVDAYEMSRSGLPITNPSSGYNPSNPYSTSGPSARDPRLRQTIIVNGSAWKSKPVFTYFGGTNALPLPNATKTGYYLRKHLIETINLDQKLGTVTTREHSWIIFRYGEVLLNFAEAMNEAYGPGITITTGNKVSLTALEAVNLVRRRAVMPIFPSGISQADFRTKLRNERRVELAFEDHRFWDIRRWKIGTETENIYAMKIIRDDNSNFIYEKTPLEVRPFQDKMYLYPIPQSEIFKSKNNLIQNTGW
jgi:hypothetical protein